MIGGVCRLKMESATCAPSGPCESPHSSGCIAELPRGTEMSRSWQRHQRCECFGVHPLVTGCAEYKSAWHVASRREASLCGLRERGLQRLCLLYMNVSSNAPPTNVPGVDQSSVFARRDVDASSKPTNTPEGHSPAANPGRVVDSHFNIHCLWGVTGCLMAT